MYEVRAESMSADERGALQLDRMRALIDTLLAAGGVQAERLRAAGVTGGADLADLAQVAELPTAGKRDLWDHYPLGMVAVPRERIAALHGSSGTGGRPTLVAYTAADLDLWARMCARSLCCAGATPASLVHNAYGYGLFTGGLGLHQGAVKLGAAVLPMSGGRTDRQVRLLTELRADILTCTPSYAVRIAEQLGAAGLGPDDLALTAGVLGAEPWTDGMRGKIEAMLGIKAVDIYGLSEVIGPGVATECVEGRDGLHVNEDEFVVEAIDPATGAPVADGEAGELVFSTPTKQALPLLRYRTGDIASLTRGTCVCGRTLVRMSKIRGRSDDMLVIRGVNVYPTEVERVLLDDPGIGPEYVLVVDRRQAMARLVVACESVGTGPDATLRDQWADTVAERVRAALGVAVTVRILPPGTLPRAEAGKAVRRIDWESGDEPVPGILGGPGDHTR